MLGLIIEDELEKSWSQLYLNKNEKGTYLSGFTIRNGILCEFSKKELKISVFSKILFFYMTIVIIKARK